VTFAYLLLFAVQLCTQDRRKLSSAFYLQAEVRAVIIGCPGSTCLCTHACCGMA
jgi:hypothetical protein